MARKREANESASTLTEVTLTLPMGLEGEDTGYQASQTAGGDVRLRTRARLHVRVNFGAKGAVALTRLRNGLRASGAKLGDGKPVWTSTDALRYLLESLADAE